MKIVIDKKLVTDYLVYISLFLFLTVNILSITFYSAYIPGFIIQIINLMAVLLLTFRELSSARYDFNNLIVVGITLFLALLVVLSSTKLPVYLYSLGLIYYLRNFPFRKTVEFSLPLITILFLFVILSSKAGIILDYVEISESRVRHYLGFSYSLFPSTILLQIVALHVWFKGRGIRLSSLAICLLAVTWVFLQTNSRLTFISSLLILAIALLQKLDLKFFERFKYVLLILIPSYIYAPILSYYIANRYVYMDSLMLALNKFLGGRIYLAYKSLEMYGFGILGKEIRWVGNGLNSSGQRLSGSYLYVDNMYIQVLQRYGLVFLIVIICLLTLLMMYLYRQKQYFLLSILILFAYHAMIDDLIFRLHYNIFWLLLFLPFVGRKDLSQSYIELVEEG